MLDLIYGLGAILFKPNNDDIVTIATFVAVFAKGSQRIGQWIFRQDPTTGKVAKLQEMRAHRRWRDIVPFLVLPS